MTSVVAISLSTGIVCGIWNFIAPIIGMLGWGGFGGCTAFFACPAGGGTKSLTKTLICIITGFILSSACVIAGNIFNTANSAIIASIFSAILSYVAVAVSKWNLWSYVPGIFFGCFTTFAAMGDFIYEGVLSCCNGINFVILPSLLLGVFVGFLCEQGANILRKIFNKEQSQNIDA